ncbi:MAG: hypothetical protein P4N24_13205 [Acidobacteriota bacterium]|nr:hypothetical protein [Acidobacteriota bacterium]
MKSRPRIVAETEVAGKETDAKAIVHRRIEVTVEREWVSMLMRGQAVNGPGGTVGEESAYEAPCKGPKPPAKTG